jgi:hypothetical protein
MSVGQSCCHGVSIVTCANVYKNCSENNVLNIQLLLIKGHI